jgi:hypothetical protein
MSKFAKLYEHEGIGQVLVMKTGNDEGAPSLKFIINLDGEEVAAGPTYRDDDDGWASLDKAFDKVDEQTAVDYAKALVDMMGGE